MSTNGASKAALGDLHSLVARMLADRLRTGEFSPADMANAIRFLKDNGIEAVPEAGSELEKLMQSIPNFDNPGDELPN